MDDFLKMDNIYNRKLTRGNYDTDFSILNQGNTFPSAEVRGRNKVYRFNKKLFSGEYSYNRNLVALIDDVPTEIPYKVLPINQFELIVNKIDALLFSNEIVVSTGDINRDKEIQKLIDKTHWVRDIRKGVKLCQIYGDAVLKTGRHGVSCFPPLFAYKVVDESNKDKVLGFVLHEIIYEKSSKNSSNRYKPTHIRIIISSCGYEYERIYEYKGSNKIGTIGRPVRYKYKDRWISKNGNYYYTEIPDCETVQWLSINSEKDGLYGASAFDNVKSIVLALENRLSTEQWILDNHAKPILLLGMSSVISNEKTGTYTASIIQGKYMLKKGDGEKPEYLTWDGKLESSKEFRESLKEIFYELTEMGKTFLSGEYTGNVSEESLNNMIKSALDRGNRILNELYYDIRKSLYILCKLNGIKVNIEDITINFNIGRVDDTKVIADTCKTLNEIGLFSKETLRSKFFGFNQDDSTAEEERINKESLNVDTNRKDYGGMIDGDTNTTEP